jgi:outer membrane protein
MRLFLSGAVFCISALNILPLTAGAQSGALPTAPIEKALPLTQSQNVPQDGAAIAPAASTSMAAQTHGVELSLVDAEARALKNQPRLLAEQYRTQAANKRISEPRASYFPQAYGNLTAVEANGDSAVAAGALTTSSISTRAAGGGSLLQMITDFGRTSNLVQSARLAAKASGQDEESIRQSVLTQVEDAYFSAQAAESVRNTAQAVLDFRRVTLRQLSALAQSQLRSTLDVQFAQVMVSEAELAVVRAESNVQRAQAQLAAAMGEEGDGSYVLADEPLPANPAADPAGYIREAIADRPDLKALRLRSDSALHEARAERGLNYPTVNALAAGGEVPIHDSTIHRDYGAVGVNINVPIFNGGLYSARSATAKLEATAADKDASLREVEIVRDVRMTWADARDAYLQIGVTQRLVDETNVATRLAQARYNAGLGSIVELNQAELDQTSALIAAASARFDFQRAMTAFQFAMGDVH